MDIQNLKNFLTPETWQTLEQYFTQLVIARIQKKPLPATVNSIISPAPTISRPPYQPKSGGRSLEYPPPLDTSLLAYLPPKVAKMPRRNEAISIRRDFIAEALKKKITETGINEILDHLTKAQFPIGDDYYGAVMSGGKPRIYASINNDLKYFEGKHWVRKTRDRWKWIRSKGA